MEGGGWVASSARSGRAQTRTSDAIQTLPPARARTSGPELVGPVHGAALTKISSSSDGRSDLDGRTRSGGGRGLRFRVQVCWFVHGLPLRLGRPSPHFVSRPLPSTSASRNPATTYSGPDAQIAVTQIEFLRVQ